MTEKASMPRVMGSLSTGQLSLVVVVHLLGGEAMFRVSCTVKCMHI